MTPTEFFKGHADSKRIFVAVRRAVAANGAADVLASKSQIAFRRRRQFAWAWMPGMYLRGVTPPLVLSIALDRRDRSRRWKEVTPPRHGHFQHHLEVHAAAEINDEVHAWLREAWEVAG